MPLNAVSYGQPVVLQVSHITLKSTSHHVPSFKIVVHRTFLRERE